MTVLQVNPVVRFTTSTGRIMQEIGECAIRHGWNSYIAYAKGRETPSGLFRNSTSDLSLIEGCGSSLIPVGNVVSVVAHLMNTRLFDRHGLSSVHATKTLVNRMKRISPDIVHLHNLHGYYLNYRILFDFLKKSGVPVVWTLHDCWPFTGHCYYYSAVGCRKWEYGCESCPQLSTFPASIFMDRSRRNYLEKCKAFNSLNPDQLTVVCVSEWMKGEIKRSFMRNIDCKVIHNGIDTSIFYPRPAIHHYDIKKKLGIPVKKKIILAVASVWSKHKGIEDLLALSRLLEKDELMVVVGMSEKSRLPSNIINLGRISSLDRLAEIYSVADVFINPTYQDNFPTVNLEAQACGTPVITYDTGGSPESISRETGAIVKTGDIMEMLLKVRGFFDWDIDRADSCHNHIVMNYKAEDRYQEYLTLYKRKAMALPLG